MKPRFLFTLFNSPEEVRKKIIWCTHPGGIGVYGIHGVGGNLPPPPPYPHSSQYYPIVSTIWGETISVYIPDIIQRGS